MPLQTLAISMSDDTRAHLKDGGYSLYVFRPVASSNKTGVPLVWARLDPESYFSNIPVAFETEMFCAYISNDAIAVDATIGIGTSIAASPGQTAGVDAVGRMTATMAAPLDSIYIASTAATSYSCGLAAKFGSLAATPFCAFTLYPEGLVTMQPANALFVMWATSAYDPGVFMRQSLGPGLLVHFDDSTPRAVTYDITEAWQAGQAAWAQPIGSGTVLTSILISDPGRNHPDR